MQHQTVQHRSSSQSRKKKHEEYKSQNTRIHSSGDIVPELDHQQEDYSALLFEKPLADKLRKKYEKGGRRRNLLGHTGRKPCFIDPEFQTHELCGGDCLTTVIDIAVREVGLRPRFGTPSLNKHRLWETIPNILEAESVTHPQRVQEGRHSGYRRGHYSGYRSGTLYRLKPVEEENSEKVNLTSRWKRRIIKDPHIIFHRPCNESPVHSAKFSPKQMFATLKEDLPENIRGDALDWELYSESRRHYQYARAKPIIRGDVAWDVEKHLSVAPAGRGTKRHALLDIDLGATRNLTGIVTQGAPPPTDIYPDVDYVDWKGNPVPRGCCVVEGRGHDEIYKGPFWKVLDPERPLQWVRKLEVQWRADGGRQWNSLGTFAGSWDEKSHPLHEYQGGLSCRYLRFVPIDCENGGALRVGVYGTSLGKDSGSSVRNHRDASPNDELVEYTLLEPSTLKSSGAHERDIFSCGKRWEAENQQFYISRRNTMKEQARRECKESKSKYVHLRTSCCKEFELFS
mmetsp:Transcript_61517/g.181815  ORF Transcript_61517/g.181815 Transcript_61517/m.181815 type:complete len:512 (-) Transcript_61517:59-1594(-)